MKEIYRLAFGGNSSTKGAAIESAITDLRSSPGNWPDINFLRDMTNDSDPLVRRHAVGALGEVGTKDEMGFLRMCRNDPDPRVNAAVEEALQVIMFRMQSGK